MKVDWKKNLYITWIGCFFTGVSFSLVMPFIPIYINDLGVTPGQSDLFAGLSISVTALAAAIFSPIWGSLADRRGRKMMMIRAAAGMTFSMGMLAFVSNVYQLLALRFLTGVLSGYIPNATAMIASQVPREKNGWALGMLSTGSVAGNLIGPFIGGWLADTFGIRNVFKITGIILLICTVLTVIYVKEDFKPVLKENILSMKSIIRRMDHSSVLLGLFVTTLILQIGVTSISPILTKFIQQLGGRQGNLLMVSGFIVSVSGFSAFFASPFLGKLGDRYGNQNILLIGLIFFMLCILPMSLVKTPFQLGVLRFLMGFSTGALMPSINAMISRITPKEGVSRVFGFNQMSQNFGQVLGPLLGSTIAAHAGYRWVFVGTAGFILVNIFISLFNFKGTLWKKVY